MKRQDLIGEIWARFASYLPDAGSQEMLGWEEQPVLMDLVQQIKETLSPVEPAAAFRQRLERDLLTAWRVPVLVEEPTSPTRFLTSRKTILLGTAAVGSIASVCSLLGLVIFVIWRRLATRPASQGSSGVVL